MFAALDRAERKAERLSVELSDVTTPVQKLINQACTAACTNSASWAPFMIFENFLFEEWMPNTLLKAGGKVIVIGAGFGGIAVALRMRARGYDVTLLDRLTAIGGRAQVLSVAAFAMTLARPLLPLLFYSMNYLAFSEKNERSCGISFSRSLVPVLFSLWRQFDYRPSVEDTNAEIRRFSPDDVAGYAKLLRTSKAIFRNRL